MKLVRGELTSSKRETTSCVRAGGVTERRASFRKILFLSDDSKRVARKSSRTNKQGMIGRPAPVPTSATEALTGRYLRSIRDSRTWRTANSPGEHGATR